MSDASLPENVPESSSQSWDPSAVAALPASDPMPEATSPDVPMLEITADAASATATDAPAQVESVDVSLLLKMLAGGVGVPDVNMEAGGTPQLQELPLALSEPADTSQPNAQPSAQPQELADTIIPFEQPSNGHSSQQPPLSEPPAGGDQPYVPDDGGFSFASSGRGYPSRDRHAAASSVELRRDESGAIEFPPGTRVFIGGLQPSFEDKDLRPLFEPFGKIHQILIKPTYAFVQYDNTEALRAAIRGVHGVMAKGCTLSVKESRLPAKVYPAGSKPPAPVGGYTRDRYTDDRAYRRDMYSGRDRGGSSGGRPPYDYNGDRYGGPDHRSHSPGRGHYPPRYDPYRSDDHPPPFHGRRDANEYSSWDRRDSRFRHDWPQERRANDFDDRRYRERSPPPRPRPDERHSAISDDFPLPHRFGRHVPLVQVVVLDDISREFIAHVDSSLRNTLRDVDVLILHPRIPLRSAIRQMIIEGVRAFVFLERKHEATGRVLLQVFERHIPGTELQMRFDEYEDITVDEALAVLQKVHAEAATAMPAAVQPQIYQPTSYPPATTSYQPSTSVYGPSSTLISGGPAQAVPQIDLAALANVFSALQGLNPAQQPHVGAAPHSQQFMSNAQHAFTHIPQSSSNQGVPQTDVAELLKMLQQSQ